MDINERLENAISTIYFRHPISDEEKHKDFEYVCELLNTSGADLNCFPPAPRGRFTNIQTGEVMTVQRMPIYFRMVMDSESANRYYPYLKYALDNNLIDVNLLDSNGENALCHTTSPKIALLLVLNGANMYFTRNRVSKFTLNKSLNLIQLNFIYSDRAFFAKLHMKAYKIQKWFLKININK